MVGRNARVHSRNRWVMGWIRRGWRLWARALGSKEGTTYEADKVAIWRTLIVLQAVITNGFIVWNILRKW